MKFKNLHEVIDDDINLTHEVLTHHGFQKNEGSYVYSHHKAEELNHERLHQDMQSIGWKKKGFQAPRTMIDGFNSGTALFSKGFRTMGISDGHMADNHYASASMFDGGVSPIKG